MYLFYSILYGAALLLLVIPQYLKRPAGLRRAWLREKCGLFGLPAFTAAPVWIHAVSVGEVNAALPFLKKLKEAHPDIPFILSTITDTGRQVARQKAPEGTHVVYLPFDLTCILRPCFRRLKPRLVIVMETELWPNMFRTASELSVPVVVMNGRISEGSARGYGKIAFFMKDVLAPVALFGMQSVADAGRITALGAEKSRVQSLGNFKFDMACSQTLPDWLRSIQGPVIVAGSTHEGEEQIIIDAYRENVYLFPGLKLIIAPRHPERFQEAEEVIIKSDIRYMKRSGLGHPQEGGLPKFSILLLDSVGELTALYSIADMAIMGKSFEGRGGQNPLEPAFWGKPVICGPHMENFPFIREFYEAGAAFEVTSTGIAKKIKELLLQPDRAKAAGEKARQLYLKNSGAVDRAVKLVENFIR